MVWRRSQEFWRLVSCFNHFHANGHVANHLQWWHNSLLTYVFLLGRLVLWSIVYLNKLRVNVASMIKNFEQLPSINRLSSFILYFFCKVIFLLHFEEIESFPRSRPFSSSNHKRNTKNKKKKRDVIAQDTCRSFLHVHVLISIYQKTKKKKVLL